MSSQDHFDVQVHRRELGKLALFAAAAGILVGLSYLVPQAEAVRPWLPGEEVPLVHLLQREAEVQEDERGELQVVVVEPVVEEAEPPPQTPEARLPVRPGAVRTALELPDGALDRWFEGLVQAEAGEPGRIVRAVHWGDSTIAADGITSTVRRRLQERFGDGGPGFLPVHVDTRWQIRPGVLRSTREGEWQTFNMTFGGAEDWRYGLGGNSSTAPEGVETETVLGGLKIHGARQPLHRFDVYYQARPGGGTVSVVPRGTRGARIETGADALEDRFKLLTSEGGSSILWIKTHGDGPVTLYGVALETAGPGVTWETQGVAGSSIASMINHQGRQHIKRQVARRDPDLLVYQTGGNELDYPDLVRGEGVNYKVKYHEAFGKLRAGAEGASCLIVGPIDQGTRLRGRIVSQDNLDKIIGLQRAAAVEEGCAFWDPRRAMGGEGSFGRWVERSPRLASTDLLHLTDAGFELLGDSLADALLDAYEQWKLANPGKVPPPAEPVFEADWEQEPVAPPAPEAGGG